MPPSRAFADPIELTGGVLRINGSSNPLAAGEPMSRHVALEQGEASVAGPASTGAGKLWDATLSAKEFQEDVPAKTVGTETYFGAATPLDEPLLLSFSRAQTFDVDAA